MIQASIAASDEPIYLRPGPKDRLDAMKNLFACSREGRLSKPFQDRDDRVCLPPIPRIRECFGWMQFKSEELFSLFAVRRDLSPGEIIIDRQRRHFLPEKEYYAVVYEYIPSDITPLDDAAIQSVFDFFWLSGFTFRDIRPENWLGGIVLDMACFVNPLSVGWYASNHERIDVSSWPKNFFHGPALGESPRVH